MTKWFDRKFQPLNRDLSYAGILERLYGTPLRLEFLIRQIPITLQKERIEDTWSIQENVGHLLDLEPLWAGRVNDFINGAPQLRPADLTNAKTHQARHHDQAMDVLLSGFRAERSRLTELLEELKGDQLQRTALHPRLQTPMLPVDLAYFVAEHDDHHIARIREIWRTLE